MDIDDYNVNITNNTDAIVSNRLSNQQQQHWKRNATNNTKANEALIAEMATAAGVGAPLKKARKPRPKLNSALLLSDRGFKYLRQNLPLIPPIQATPDNVPTDVLVDRLDGLMLAYREWAHYLFPSLQFDDFVGRVERECRTKPMKIYLHKLREAQAAEAAAFDEAEFMANLVASEAAAATAKLASKERSEAINNSNEEEEEDIDNVDGDITDDEQEPNSEDEQFINDNETPNVGFSHDDDDEDDDIINKIIRFD